MPTVRKVTPPAPAPELPPELAGWRWSTNAKTGHYFLMHPEHPATFTTRHYPDPDKAIAEAKRWVLSQPKDPDRVTLDDAIARLRVAGYDVQPQGMHWSVRLDGDGAHVLKAYELVSLAQDVPAAIATMAADTPGALSTALQECARRYVAAREQAGAALLEMAAALHDARRQAEHGEWYTFLESIGTGEDAADRLLNIHELAASNPAYADAIRRNFLNPTTAALLARPSTPPAVVEQVLSGPEPPSKRAIEAKIQESKSRTGAGFDPADDDTHIAAAHKILNTLDQWADSARPARLKEAYGHARAVRDTAKRDVLFSAIDLAMDGTAPARGADTIIISTDIGPHAITPTRRVKDLALHPSIKNPPDPAYAWTITYVPTGQQIGNGFPSQEQADAAFGELVKLNWSGMQGGTAPPTLVTQIKAVLARHVVPVLQEATPAQAPPPAPLPEPPLDPRTAAVAWLSRMQTTLAHCPDSTMFRLSEMLAAVAHIEALLDALAETGPAPQLAEVGA